MIEISINSTEDSPSNFSGRILFLVHTLALPLPILHSSIPYDADRIKSSRVNFDLHHNFSLLPHFDGTDD